MPATATVQPAPLPSRAESTIRPESLPSRAEALRRLREIKAALGPELFTREIARVLARLDAPARRDDHSCSPISNAPE